MCIAPWANYEETSTVELAFDVSFAELNQKQFLNTGRHGSTQISNKVIFDQDIRNILQVRRARSYPPIPKMLAHHISTICTRQVGRIDNVALKRIDPYPAARRAAVLHRRWLRA